MELDVLELLFFTVVADTSDLPLSFRRQRPVCLRDRRFVVLKSMRICIYTTMTIGQGILIGLSFLLHGMPHHGDWSRGAMDLLPLALPLLPGIIITVRFHAFP